MCLYTPPQDLLKEIGPSQAEVLGVTLACHGGEVLEYTTGEEGLEEQLEIHLLNRFTCARGQNTSCLGPQFHL